MILLGEFATILPNENPLSPEYYLNGVNKSILLKLASFMLGLNPDTSKYNNWRELLNMWFRKENFDFANKLYQRCKELESDNQTTISLFSPVAALKFFEFSFSVDEGVVSKDEITAEIDIFKAYLIFLTNTVGDEKKSEKYLQSLDTKLRLLGTLINQVYPTADFSNYDLGDIFTCQLVKAHLLFKFLESTNEADYLLKEFYRYFNINTWREYFQFLLPLVQAHTKHPTEGWTELWVSKGDNFDRNCNFLEALSLKEFDPLIDFDFKLLRGNPIYKIDEGVYGIISPLFVFEKIYKGLYFKLNEIHNTLPKEQKKIKDLRSFYTSNFSENYLLYSLLTHIYGKRKYIKYSGHDIEEQGIVGGPDYYIRNGNYIFLFENKDVFINAEIKQSSDFQLIEAELKKKLYFDVEESGVIPKAIIQIVNNIKKILTKENAFDTGYKQKSIQIYPLLILHDSSFNCPGLNALVNKWFNDELEVLKKAGLNLAKVRPITVINIDTLLLYSDFLRLKKISLNEIVDAYIDHQNFNQKKRYRDSKHLGASYMDTLLHFSFFINNYTNYGHRMNHIQLFESAIHNIAIQN